MLQLKHYRAQLCDSRLSYEFLPQEEMKLNLLEMGSALEKYGKTMRIKTPFILVFLVSGVKVSLYANGKILTQNVPDMETANGILKTVVKWVNEAMEK
jgi:hypothetical protein